MADWDEIKRLAADFQRTQASDTLQRISERNCIDILKKLTELNLIHLIYTIDGGEVITPEHLIKEVEDEIYVNNGRMQLHDLASRLKVDYKHIENSVEYLVRDKPEEYQLVLGQVIHSRYKDFLRKQVQDCLFLEGQLSVAEFSKNLDLPTDFLLTLIKELLPTAGKDAYLTSPDGRTYYTAEIMNKYRSIIAGCLTAITRPTSLASLMKRIPERIFTPITESLLKDGRIDATVENRTLVPAIYSREQNNWVDQFYLSNSYISYDVLARMNIKQPKSFLTKRFKDGIPLKTCFVSKQLQSQMEALVEESSINGWLDLRSVIPSAIEPEDIEQLLQDIIKRYKGSCLLINQTCICSLGYVELCKETLSGKMQSMAQKHLEEGKLVNYFLSAKPKEQSIKEVAELSASDVLASPQVATDDVQVTPKESKKDKKDKKSKQDDIEESGDELSSKKVKGRKSGGGTQGREIKQKSVKKKYVPGNRGSQKLNDNSDEESMPTKSSRSSKGRAARRAISPDRDSSAVKAKDSRKSRGKSESEKEPLVFMSLHEISKTLSHGTEDDSGELFDSIANMIKDDLDQSYAIVARNVFDEYLREQAEKSENLENDDPSKSDEIDVIS